MNREEKIGLLYNKEYYYDFFLLLRVLKFWWLSFVGCVASLGVNAQ